MQAMREALAAQPLQIQQQHQEVEELKSQLQQVLAAAQGNNADLEKAGSNVTATQAAAAAAQQTATEAKHTADRAATNVGEVKTSLGSADGDGSGEYLDQPGNQVSTAGRREPLAAALPVDAGTGIGRVGSGCRTGQPASVEGRRGIRHLLAGTGVVAPGHRGEAEPRKSQIAYPHYLCAKPAHPALAHPHALRLTFLCSQRPCSLAGLPRSN